MISPVLTGIGFVALALTGAVATAVVLAEPQTRFRDHLAHGLRGGCAVLAGAAIVLLWAHLTGLSA